MTRGPDAHRSGRPATVLIAAIDAWARARRKNPVADRSLEETERWIRDRLGEGRWLAWVAETGNEICGHVFLNLVERMPEPYGDNNPIGYVTNFYVTPSRRNKGVGAALLEALTQHSRGADYDTLIVWPSERSSSLYRRSGFQPPEEVWELSLDT